MTMLDEALVGILSSLGTGILSSLVTQAVKREKAGALENILVAAAVAFGGSQAAVGLGYAADPVMTVGATYAWYGLTRGKPMEALKFAIVDRLLEGIGKAFGSASSRTPPP